MFCSKCGSKNKSNSNYCYNCRGALLSSAENVELEKRNNLSDNITSPPAQKTSINTLAILSVICVILVGFFLKNSLVKSVPVYSYEPSVVSLTGVLVAPRGEDPNGKFVKYYAVEMPEPINVKGDKSNPFNSEDVNNIKQVQLTGDANTINQIKSSIGKQVKLTGVLFHSHSGYHYTNVLMTVNSINLN